MCAHTVPTVPILIKTHNSVLYSQAQLVWVRSRQVCILQRHFDVSIAWKLTIFAAYMPIMPA